MKKVLLIIAATLATAVAVSAQDMAQATETYNNGVMVLKEGKNAEAIENFKSALTMAEACGEEGADIVNNCHENILRLLINMGNEHINNREYAEGIAKLDEAIAFAKEWNADESVKEAEAKKCNGYMNQATDAMNAKDFAFAADLYKKLLEINAGNGMALLRLGLCYTRLGDFSSAKDSFVAAAANGQEKAANKELSKVYLKEAQKALQEKKYADAYEAAMKSNEYVESGNALYAAGVSAQKLGQEANAIAAFEKFVVVAPNDKRANSIKYTLAYSYQNSGNKAKAIEYYQMILSDPNYAETAKAQIAALQK